MGGGACTNGVQWIDASSRDYKQGIEIFTQDEAMEILMGFEAVKFAYKALGSGFGYLDFK